MLDVFGPFKPGDSLRVTRLQRRGIALEPENQLNRPRSPLAEAWLALLSQQAMGQPAFVLVDAADGEAFVQIRFRPHQAAADVVFLSPCLAEGPWTARAWARMLEGACADLARRGIQRVFAGLPESGLELDVFQQAGFAPYSREDVYRLTPSDRVDPGGGLPGLRPLRLEDWAALQKLCVAITPQRVRQAEGGVTLSLDQGKETRQVVLPGDTADELRAVLLLRWGAPAAWLRLLVHPDLRDGADELVRWALGELPAVPERPVFCAVRGYEKGVRAALEASGFAHHGGRVLLVKHTAVWVKAAHELAPALKGSAEPVPPAYHANGEPALQPSKGRLAARNKPG